MALVQHKECDACHTTTQHINGDCIECRHIKRKQEIAAWEVLPVERKLSDLRERIEELEKASGPLNMLLPRC